MSYSWYNYKPKPSSHTIYCGGVKRYYVNPSKLPSLSETDINPQTKKEKKFHYLIYPTTCKRAHRKISLGFPNDSLSRSDQITRSFFLFWVPYVCPTFTRPVTLVTNTSVEWLLLCSYCVKYIRTQKYSRLRCLLRIKGLVIGFYLGWSGHTLLIRKI